MAILVHLVGEVNLKIFKVRCRPWIRLEKAQCGLKGANDIPRVLAKAKKKRIQRNVKA